MLQEDWYGLINVETPEMVIMLNVLFPFLLLYWGRWPGRVKINRSRHWSVEMELQDDIKTGTAAGDHIPSGHEILRLHASGSRAAAMRLYGRTIAHRMRSFYHAPVVKVCICILSLF